MACLPYYVRWIMSNKILYCFFFFIGTPFLMSLRRLCSKAAEDEWFYFKRVYETVRQLIFVILCFVCYSWCISREFLFKLRQYWPNNSTLVQKVRKNYTRLLYSVLFCSVTFRPLLFYSTLLYSILFYSILFYSYKLG